VTKRTDKRFRTALDALRSVVSRGWLTEGGLLSMQKFILDLDFLGGCPDSNLGGAGSECDPRHEESR
jgi:hypothetical protein